MKIIRKRKNIYQVKRSNLRQNQILQQDSRVGRESNRPFLFGAIMRNKGIRKEQAKLKQKKRMRFVEHKCTARQKGYYKNNHIGCGCPMCKPWKHKLANKMKPSDRRKSEDQA